MDTASADLILSLHLNDLAEIRESLVATSNSYPNEDAKIALDIYRQEPCGDAASLADRHYGEKLGEADDPDNHLPISSATSAFEKVLKRSCSDLAQEVEIPCKRGPCAACCSSLSPRQLVRGPCGHSYCKTCGQALFRDSVKKMNHSFHRAVAAKT